MKRLKKRDKILIIIFFALLVILYVLIYVVPKVSNVLVGNYVAEYSRLDVGIEKRCLIVRDETVFYSQDSGDVKHSRNQGDRLRIGTKVLSVGGSNYTTQAGGILSYFYDGLEDTINSKDISSITESIFETLDSKDSENGQQRKYEVRTCSEGSTKKDEPLYKLVTGNVWYIVSWLSNEEAVDYAEGNDVLVMFPDGKEILGTVYAIQQQQDKLKLIISCDKYYEYFDKYRDVSCKITAYTENGIIIENSSITEIDGQKGVYVINKQGKHVFTPIYILYTHGDVSLIVSNLYTDKDGYPVRTVRNYERVLKDYKKAKIVPSEDNTQKGDD